MKKDKHFICKVQDSLNNFQTIVQRYCDVKTSSAAAKHFKNEAAIKPYLGDRRYRISFRSNPVIIQDTE